MIEVLLSPTQDRGLRRLGDVVIPGAWLPRPAIRAIVALASGWRRAPGFAAGILRMANIGIKGVVHSLYWSDLHQQGIHRQIGYDARIDEAAYEASIDHGVEENR